MAKRKRHQKTHQTSAGKQRRRASKGAFSWSPVDAALSEFEPTSLRYLLDAAVDSPGCGHRLPSLSILWVRAMGRANDAHGIEATPYHLPRLLHAARRAAADLKALEDCWPVDPRLIVRFPIGGRRFELHPGGLTNPLQALRMCCGTAMAIDPYVVDRYGFTLSDLLQVGLAYADQRLAHIRASWSNGALPLDDVVRGAETLKERVARIAATPVVLTAAEQEAAATMPMQPEQWYARCVDTERAPRAWAWATRDAIESINLRSEGLTLGPTLAVKTASAPVPVPAALVLDGIVFATAVLASEAAEDAASRRRLQVLTEQRAAAVLGHRDRFRFPTVDSPAVDPPADTSAESRDASPREPPVTEGAVIVAAPAERHVFVVGTTSALHPTSLRQSLQRAEAELDAFDVPFLRAHEVPVDEQALAIRVVVYGGPFVLPPETDGEICRIHVEDLREAWREGSESDDGMEIGSALLWQFLEEFALLPGVRRLLALDFDDVWRAWLTLGGINLTGGDAVDVHPTSVPDDRHWRHAAAWEPVEQILFAAGLPPSWEWVAASLDEGPGQATVGSLDDVWLLLADPPLVLHVPIDRELARFGVDPFFAVGVADGIRLTASNDGTVRNTLAGVGEHPLICEFALTAQRTPGASADAVGIGFAGGQLEGSTDPRLLVKLQVGPDWLELLADDPATAHSLLGRGLASGLGQALGRPLNVEQRLIDAWDASPPVARVRPNEAGLLYRGTGSADLPLSSATRGRARRTLARCLVARNAPQGFHRDAEALAFADEHFIPALREALARAIAEWSSDAVLIVAKHVNDAHAERARREGELAIALSSPWRAAWREIALERADEAEATRALELLFEAVLAKASSGGIRPDRFDVADAVGVAREALRIGLALSGARAGLHGLAIAIGPEGSYVAQAVADAQGDDGRTAESVARRTFDAAAYLTAIREDSLRPAAAKAEDDSEEVARLELSPDAGREDTEFRGLRSLDVPPSFKRADDALRTYCGTGLDGLIAVLGTALTWGDGSGEVSVLSRERLASEAAAWSSLPHGEIESALARLTLDSASLRTEGLRYWEQERRRYRLATQPLVELDTGELLIMPWRIHATQRVYTNYMAGGRLPWHPQDLPVPVRDAFTDYWKRANDQLEREAVAAAARVGLPLRANIEQHDAEEVGLLIPGEIDLVVGDPSLRVLWICEVKDSALAVSPSTIARRIAKFFDRGGYVDRLLERVSAIRANVAAALDLLGVETTATDWRIVPVMITRRLEPAAFVRPCDVTFTTVDRLSRLFGEEQDAAR